MKAKAWVTQQEKILKQWSEESMGLSYMHDRSYKHYSSLHVRFSLPVIILSTIAGTANFATGSFPAAYRDYVSIATGALGLISGTITTIAQFLKIPERLEQHRASSNDFGKMARAIRVELSLPLDERSMTGRECIAHYRNEMENLLERAPDISLNHVKMFTNKFKQKEFHMPDIVDLNKVDIFIDTDKGYEEHIQDEAKKMLELSKKHEVQVHHVSDNLSSFMSQYAATDKKETAGEATKEPTGDDAV